MSDLTKEEAAWLLHLLANMQINGKPDEARQALAMLDSVTDKLNKVVSKQ